jgi:N utilization substance protein A
MFDLKTIARAIEQLAEEKHIETDKVVEAVEAALAAAYKKEYEKRGEVVRATFDVKTGNVSFAQVKIVVDETTVDMTPQTAKEIAASAVPEQDWRSSRYDAPEPTLEEGKLPRYNPDRHILVDEARNIKADAIVGEEFVFPLETKIDFGRIASQTAKQNILQKLREAERDSIMSEFKNKEGEIVTGTVQRFERGTTYIDIGRATGVMFYNESIPGEHYRTGDRMKFYVLAIQSDMKGPGIILSRAHPRLVVKLFALESPEIADGSVEIKAIAREAGNRTKIAVASHMKGVDPVGCCVGQRGTRVMAVSGELRQEKIDIIEFSEDPAEFIAHALSPAKAASVEILPRREARVSIPDDQLSLAIGKGGQNVRLAHRLTGWKIDIRAQSNPETAVLESDPSAENETPDAHSETAPESTAEHS